MDPPTSLFEKWIARSRHPGLRIGIGLAVLAAFPIACRALSQCLAGGQATGTLPADLNALAIYEARLKESRSWPYNTAMLRTLVLSVLAPAVPVVGRYLLDALSR
jgi:hypothetical protein